MTPQKKKFIVVLNEEEYNLHEGRSAAKDGPNLSPILDSDSLWIAPSHDPLFYKGDSESMEFVTDWFSADPPADFADKSPATLKAGGEADSLSPVGQVLQ